MFDSIHQSFNTEKYYISTASSDFGAFIIFVIFFPFLLFVGFFLCFEIKSKNRGLLRRLNYRIMETGNIEVNKEMNINFNE